MEMKRREFLARSIARMGGVLLGSGCMDAAQQKATKHDPYELVPLGKTGIKVSRVGLGTGMRGGGRQSNHTRMGKEKFDTLAMGCYERGVRMFDLADLYGTHPFLAGALKKMRRKDYAITSKIWFRRGGIPEKERPNPDIVVERFLRELKTDYVDLYFMHGVKDPSEFTKECKAWGEKNKKAGKIRYFGFSTHMNMAACLAGAATFGWTSTISGFRWGAVGFIDWTRQGKRPGCEAEGARIRRDSNYGWNARTIPERRGTTRPSLGDY